MANDPRQRLADLKKENEFFIGIDSDGCVFDSMEIKHKECFCPVTIKYWGLQNVSKYAREAWDFVNLYSTSRGCNRFIALLKVVELLGRRREVIQRGAKLPDLAPLAAWTKQETKLGNPALTAYAAQAKDPVIDTALRWSLAINEAIADMVSGIPPFPFVRESLEKMKAKADMIVVSQTPLEALEREWREHDIARYARVIAGQEYGTKTEHVALAAGGKYPADRVLVIGDALGDCQAAQANHALFYPVNPGREDESWERFAREGLDRFFAGTFAGAYQEKLIEEFRSYLPDTPPWERK